MSTVANLTVENIILEILSIFCRVVSYCRTPANLRAPTESYPSTNSVVFQIPMLPGFGVDKLQAPPSNLPPPMVKAVRSIAVFPQWLIPSIDLQKTRVCPSSWRCGRRSWRSCERRVARLSRGLRRRRWMRFRCPPNRRSSLWTTPPRRTAGASEWSAAVARRRRRCRRPLTQVSPCSSTASAPEMRWRRPWPSWARGHHALPIAGRFK